MGIISDAEAILGRSVAPGAMTLVVGDLNERLRVREMEEEFRAALAPDVPLPSFFLEAVSVDVDGRPLVPEPLHNLRVGTFSITGDAIQTHPQETGRILRIVYRARIQPFDEDRATRVQSAYPSLFLYGLLAHHTMLVRDDSGAVWQQKYEAALATANENDPRARQSQISMRPVPRYCP